MIQNWSLCIFYWKTMTSLDRRFESFFWWVYVSFPFHFALFFGSTTILSRPCKSLPLSFLHLCTGLFCMISSNIYFQVFVAPNAVSFSVVFYFFPPTCFLSFNMSLISPCHYRISSLKCTQMSLELSFSAHCICGCFGLCGIHLISPHPSLNDPSLLLFSP